jgi:hypothetical protein
MKRDKQLMFMGSVGRDFMETAVRAYKGYAASGQPLLTLPIPLVVCYAFASEVNLKLILLKYGTKVRGHKLKALYELLPSEIKVEIKSKVRIGDMVFDKELGRISEAFVEWRYVYESDQKSLNLIFIGQFATEIQRIALRLVPQPPRTYTSVKLE